MAAHPMRTGSLFALLAALMFGMTAPLVQRFGAHAGPLPTAVLLYAGALLATLTPARQRVHARLWPEHAGRLLSVAVLGAFAAPTALAWGLQHTGAMTASLLLNFEAVFTVLVGWLLYREHVGGRVAVAVSLMAIAGVCLVTASAPEPGAVGWGALAILLATLAWALDNTLTRPLADLDTTVVVRWKAALGGALGFGLSLALGQPFPAWVDAALLLACGATGYGYSLRLYLLAQRRIGAGRTASIFAVAPFAGTAVAWFMGDRSAPLPTAIAATLFAIGVYLHLTEQHGHPHTHEPTEHAHAHRHDDGHHDHHHTPPVDGEHTHVHQHAELTHVHPHAPDVHHQHRHG